jgi:hypothetical protein
MSLESTLAGWTNPSSATEQEKQDRTERMIREAVRQHPAFNGCSLTVYAKGSYANNTNVRADSDVDIAVQCHEVFYYDQEVPGAGGTISPYSGPWTPQKLRSELVAALRAKFPGQVDTSGSTAIAVNSSTARVDADVVPCFDYRYYFRSGVPREGTRVFKTSLESFENFPVQQLDNGRSKNNRTQTTFKKAVRIMKRVENTMFEAGVHRQVPSFFIECLVYNCPDSTFQRSTWTDVTKGVIVHVWNGLNGAEPSEDNRRWLEVNECKYLFHQAQKWTRQDGRDFAKAAWNYLGLS